MDCNKAIASKFDFQTYTQVCVVANKACRQRTLSCQNFNTPSMQTVITIVVIIQRYSVPLYFLSAFTLFVEQSEFAILRVERF
jgi:hypothetical protein